MFRILTVFGALLLISCSSGPALQNNTVNKVDQSGMDDDVAGRFEVSDTKVVPTPAPPPPTPTKKQRRGKKGKAPAKEAKKPVAKKFEFASRRPAKMPFSPGERTLMSITYLGVEAGTLDLRVLPYKFIGDRKAYHFRGHGLSTSVFALFYRVNDVGDSFMDYDGLFSHRFQLKVDESRQERDLVEFYDQEKNIVHYWEKMVHVKKGLRITQFAKEVEQYAQDAVTAAFYLRTLPLEMGKEYSYPMVTNGKVWTVTARVIRKENLVTAIGTIPAIVVQPETRFEGVLKTVGASYMWLSDDEHRNFLKVDAKVKIGSVVAYLKQLDQGEPETP
jgi:hypothetical protein